MGTMIFLMYIKIIIHASGLLTNQCFHALISSIFTPSVKYIQFFQPIYSIHFKECQTIGNFSANLCFTNCYIGQYSAHLLQHLCIDNIELNRMFFFFLGHSINTLKYIVILNNITTGIGKFIIFFFY